MIRINTIHVPENPAIVKNKLVSANTAKIIFQKNIIVRYKNFKKKKIIKIIKWSLELKHINILHNHICLHYSNLFNIQVF